MKEKNKRSDLMAHQERHIFCRLLIQNSQSTSAEYSAESKRAANEYFASLFGGVVKVRNFERRLSHYEAFFLDISKLAQGKNEGSIDLRLPSQRKLLLKQLPLSSVNNMSDYLLGLNLFANKLASAVERDDHMSNNMLFIRFRRTKPNARVRSITKRLLKEVETELAITGLEVISRVNHSGAALGEEEFYRSVITLNQIAQQLNQGGQLNYVGHTIRKSKVVKIAGLQGTTKTWCGQFNDEYNAIHRQVDETFGLGDLKRLFEAKRLMPFRQGLRAQRKLLYLKWCYAKQIGDLKKSTDRFFIQVHVLHELLQLKNKLSHLWQKSSCQKIKDWQSEVVLELKGTLLCLLATGQIKHIHVDDIKQVLDELTFGEWDQLISFVKNSPGCISCNSWCEIIKRWHAGKSASSDTYQNLIAQITTNSLALTHGEITHEGFKLVVTHAPQHARVFSNTSIEIIIQFIEDDKQWKDVDWARRCLSAKLGAKDERAITQAAWGLLYRKLLVRHCMGEPLSPTVLTRLLELLSHINLSDKKKRYEVLLKGVPPHTKHSVKEQVIMLIKQARTVDNWEAVSTLTMCFLSLLNEVLTCEGEAKCSDIHLALNEIADCLIQFYPANKPPMYTQGIDLLFSALADFDCVKQGDKLKQLKGPILACSDQHDPHTFRQLILTLQQSIDRVLYLPAQRYLGHSCCEPSSLVQLTPNTLDKLKSYQQAPKSLANIIESLTQVVDLITRGQLSTSLRAQALVLRKLFIALQKGSKAEFDSLSQQYFIVVSTTAKNHTVMERTDEQNTRDSTLLHNAV